MNANNGQKNVLSVALMEEIELLSAICQQIFEHADIWYKCDVQGFADLKDYTLFALTRMLHYCDTDSIIPSSVTEQHLAKISNSRVERNQEAIQNAHLMTELERKEISGIDLKVEISLQKIFLNLTASLLNCLVLSKRME